MNDHISAEDFAAYVDGLLSTEKKNELESHFSHCPACLDELVEIAAIMDSQNNIPAQFLKLALGEKNKITKPVLHLRLVFEIAAAFVLVVFIGYFFLSNNRFWQATEQQKPSIVTDKGLPPGSGKSVPISALENKPQESTEKPFRPAPAYKEENLQKKELSRTATAPEAVDAMQMDFTAKGQMAAKMMKEKAAATPTPRVRIEGDVILNDLRNPELLSAWSWFQKDLVLELQIDSTGKVIAVVPLGKFDPSLAEKAENEARKLLFSVSEKKSRRARLIANEKPPI
jgi:hypothetical protein